MCLAPSLGRCWGRLWFSIRNTRLIQVRACLYKVQIAIKIASYWSGNETSTADIDTVHKCLGNTDLSIRLFFRLADCIFIPWQISHLRSAAVLWISSGSSRNAPGMSTSVSTVVTEAWSVENYQQPGTVLVLARRKNSGSDAIKNNCILTPLKEGSIPLQRCVGNNHRYTTFAIMRSLPSVIMIEQNTCVTSHPVRRK